MGARLGLLVLACCLSAPARSSDDGPGDFIFARLSAAFTPPRDGDTSFLVLANPGIGLPAAVMKAPFERVCLLLDQVPLVARNYQGSGQTYSRVYEEVLNSAEVTRFQVAAQRVAATAARRTLYDKARPGQFTRQYAAYLKYETQYSVAQDARSLGQVSDQVVTAAWKRWDTLGHRLDIQKALEALHQAYANNAQAMFHNLRQDFRLAQRQHGQAGGWLPVLTEPPMETWLSGQGWHPMGFQQDPKAPGRWPLALALQVELKRVSVNRPWMDTAIFTAHTWRLRDGARFTRLSDGDPAHPGGPMPVLVTGLLLARKLVLTLPDRSAEAVPERLGPFDLARHLPGRTDRGRRAGAAPEGTALTVADPQIIAFFCQPMPKSPTPDPNHFR